MKFIIFALIPLILFIGISSAIPFSDAAESNQICIDKVWIENIRGKIACVTPNTAEKLVQRGWGTLLSDDGIDDKHTDPVSSLQEDIAISIQKDNNGVITSDQIKCQIDSYTSTILGKKMVPVNIMHGNEVLEYTEIVFDSVTATVTYNSGKDGFQLTDGGQSFLIMLMNDENGSSVNSSMYDYQLKSQSGPINVLHLDTTEKQIRLQCWI